MRGDIKMKIIRTEVGNYSRSLTLEIDECVVNTVNNSLTASLVAEVSYVPLTEKEIWDIMTLSVKAPRFQEEYFVDLEFYHGVMKLGDFVHCVINDIFADLPTGETEEVVEYYRDEFCP